VGSKDKECSFCHELDNANRSPPGPGLNVKARVELAGCWSTSKATRGPIEDKNYPQMLKRLKRLRGGYGVRAV
jgi:nuclear pore complex protein Nup98-Nup96